MIELFEKDIKTTDRKSSKGNQLKFERDGVWYKADNLGYEGLAECVVSDTSMDYPLGRDIFELISRARPKTICDSFEEQLEISEKLYGNGITFSYTIHDIENTLQKAYSYGEEEKERVLEIILQTRRKYGYLFRESREGNC